MKKKVLVLLMVVAVLAIGLVSCGGSDNPFVGTWEAEHAEILGESYPPEEAGVAWTIEIKDGGKGTLGADGETVDFTWEETDDGITINAEGMEMPCVIDGSQMKLDFLGMEDVFFDKK